MKIRNIRVERRKREDKQAWFVIVLSILMLVIWFFGEGYVR